MIRNLEAQYRRLNLLYFLHSFGLSLFVAGVTALALGR
jgi:hypothetical protein